MASRMKTDTKRKMRFMSITCLNGLRGGARALIGRTGTRAFVFAKPWPKSFRPNHFGKAPECGRGDDCAVLVPIQTAQPASPGAVRSVRSLKGTMGTLAERAD